MELSGTIKAIFDTKDVSAKFRKREMVLTTDERYPQQVLIEFTQDRTRLLDSATVGSEVTVSINIRGREWVSPQGDTKYFVSVQGWKIEPKAAGDAPPADEPPFPSGPPAGGSSMGDSGDDDIPF